MTDTLRTASITRTGDMRYTATNARGATLELGDGSSDHFTPVELLLVALAGCTALTADPVVARRADVDRLDVAIRADKIRDDLGSHLVDVEMIVDALFSGDGAEAARERLPDILRQAEERLCTVSRTVALGTPASVEIAD